MKPIRIAATIIGIATFNPCMSHADDAEYFDSRAAGGWLKLPATDELKHAPERMIAGSDIVACFELVAKNVETICYFTDHGVLFKVAQWGVTPVAAAQQADRHSVTAERIP